MPRKVGIDKDNLSYERMQGEPPKAFQAFRIYRDLGPDRTLNNVRISLGRPEGYLTALEKWSFTYEWVERCGLFDAEIDRRQMKESDMSLAFWEVQRQQSLNENLRLARLMRERLYQMLEHPLTKELIKNLGGREITYIVPAKWTFSTVASLAKVMAELEAATIGEALQGASEESFDVETASIEELRDYVNRTKGRGKI